MGFLSAIKDLFSTKPVTGVAIISDVEEVEEFLEDIVNKAFEKKKLEEEK